VQHLAAPVRHLDAAQALPAVVTVAAVQKHQARSERDRLSLWEAAAAANVPWAKACTQFPWTNQLQSIGVLLAQLCCLSVIHRMHAALQGWTSLLWFSRRVRLKLV